ncbi:MAG: sugar phosphate isomerase/epimerase family protein [Lachnospiraceae bacterium]
MFKIGTLADWFGVGPIEGIRESARCGASGVQLLRLERAGPSRVGRRLFRELRSVLLGVLPGGSQPQCAELGGHGFEIAADNPRKVEYMSRAVDLAAALDCGVVTTHIGRVPEDRDSGRWANMLSACREAGEYAASKQVTLAVETGPEPVERLVSFIDECGPGIGVNYDPANLVMVTKADEVAGVYAAGSRIVHTHAKDGRCNFYAGPEEVYGIFAEGGIEALNTVSTYFTETPLGEGEVRWDEYLHALAEVGFDGYLTIEREVGRDAAADIRAAVRFLRKKLENL